MPHGITVVVHWAIKPDQTASFVNTLTKMFAETRSHEGFRSIRLLRGADASDQSVMIQEWDDKETFQKYAQFRNDTGGAKTLAAMASSPPQTSFWETNALASVAA